MTETSSLRGAGVTPAPWDVIVVGAGFAGLYALHRLRQQGFRATVFEAGSGVGGTWYWNRYPGARCDVQSLVYCFTFDEQLYKEWQWTERYATQPEILRYLDFIADRLDLRRDITFNTRITGATFNETSNEWTLTAEHGTAVRARSVIMATGGISASQLPGVAGLERYQGEWYHTGQWPHTPVSFTGKRVGIIGTGSSGVQAIPLIAEQAKHLTVFQRTPPYVAPARNSPIPAAHVAKVGQEFAAYRARLVTGDLVGAGDVVISEHLPAARQRAAISEQEMQPLLHEHWAVGGLSIGNVFTDVMHDVDTNTIIGDFFRARIQEIVKDPQVADLLTPKDYPWGSKRVCVGSNYYETFNRSNVTLVDVNPAPIKEFTPTGLRTTERDYDFDMIILATGFDTLTGALTRIDIRGCGGRLLREVWGADGPQCYLGITSAGFPNMFIVNGPGSPGILGNVVVGIEQHVDWIMGLLVFARKNALQRVDVDPESQLKWFDHVNEAAFETLYVKGKNWWMKANPKPGQRPNFVPYVGTLASYRERCDKIAADGYPGFVFSPPLSPTGS